MKVSYQWLKKYYGATLPDPRMIEELLTFHSFEVDEVEVVGNDTVFDVSVLPNRASDCLCHRGIARELATLTNTALAHDPLAVLQQLPVTENISVSIEDTEACPRFTAALITGVEVRESPAWLKERLATIGQRSINNIVDATNYVMFAIGQPLHAYDATKFPQVNGTWQFGVRFAKEGEVVSLIAEGGKDEDRNVTLQGSELLIVDQSSNTPIGLAGVKGGRFAGVTTETTQIIIEAAHFHPTLTRKTARRLGIVIDASKRFENEPARELPLYAQAEVIKLITDIAGGTCTGVVDYYPNPTSRSSVAVRVARVNALLGLNLTQDDMVQYVTRLGAAVTTTTDGFVALAPFERSDLQIEEDYIEEIGRIYGLHHIVSVAPAPRPLPEYNARHYYSELVRRTLLEYGYSEVITSTFRSTDSIQLRNALASDKSYVRSSLRENLSETLTLNAHRADLFGRQDTRIFEIGTVFEKGLSNGISEHVSLAIGARIRPTGYSGKEDLLLQETTALIESALGVAIVWHTAQGIAECNFSEVLTKLPMPTEYELIPAKAALLYRPFSLYPHMTRDIALWVPANTLSSDIEALLNKIAGPLRVRTTLFDEFTKDDRTSFAFRIVFQSKEKTLTDSEVNDIMDGMYAAVSERGWEVR